MSTLSILAAVAIAVIIYHTLLVQAVLKRLMQRREASDNVLHQMRENNARTQEETHASLASTRQYQQESQQRTERFREENIRRADENVQRMEELLRLQREQVALLQQLTAQQTRNIK